MKKILMVAAMLFAGMLTYCYGQDVKVNINNQDYSTNNGEFKINGISSSEDIGGVDVEFKRIGNENEYSIVFTNYNSFTVSTLCIVEYRESNYGGSHMEEKTYNIVLRANGTKTIGLGRNACDDGSVNGMIVRKLAQ
ncbi:MAG: hypothetical protein Q4F82_08645 [bacterium]|nr:hypothetical protein [bacterium]